MGLVAIAIAATTFSVPAIAKAKPRVLVYSGSTGYRHESIPAAVASIKSLGEKAGYVIDTSGRRDALQGFLKAGKGVIGLHAASDSHYHWDWYGQMIGGYFERHPQGTPKGTVKVTDARHPATAKLPKSLERNDEWYYYKDFDPTVRVLVTIDPKTIGAGEADVNPNPLVW
jgi:type 1 glutamine amidotransferase